MADIPAAYLDTEFPENKTAILKLNGIFVEKMCSINLEFQKHTVYKHNEKNKKVKSLYICVPRALYGCLESVLL